MLSIYHYGVMTSIQFASNLLLCTPGWCINILPHFMYIWCTIVHIAMYVIVYTTTRARRKVCRRIARTANDVLNNLFYTNIKTIMINYTLLDYCV